MIKPIRTVFAVYLYLKVDIYNMGIGILIGGWIVEKDIILAWFI